MWGTLHNNEAAGKYKKNWNQKKIKQVLLKGFGSRSRPPIEIAGTEQSHTEWSDFRWRGEQSQMVSISGGSNLRLREQSQV